MFAAPDLPEHRDFETTAPDSGAPFGGARQSGIGGEESSAELPALTAEKNISTKP